jgi:glycosyltransferase involved in cell wall biosynthesis
MRLFINSLAASAGGGLTYIRNVISYLAMTPDLQVAVMVAPGIPQEFSSIPNVDFMELEVSTARRFWYEQFHLPRLLNSWSADVLLSAGNFALRNSPVPQILLSRNSIYTSSDFYHDLRSRREYGMWMDTRIRGTLARKSIHWADVTVAPSEAFAAELRRWSGRNHIVAIHHGFDPVAFTHDDHPLPPEVEEKLRAADGSLKLLFVSHYNYYRNFETLIRALPAIREGLAGQDVTLLLTCQLAEGTNPGTYRPANAANLVNELGLRKMVVELGAIPYFQLHHLYRRADIYVSPAYTETFAHPLVEAMASGLPIVVSDLPVHREICAGAAFYFKRFCPRELAGRVLEVFSSGDVRARLRSEGNQQAATFSWRKHAQELLALASSLIATNGRAANGAAPRERHK